MRLAAMIKVKERGGGDLSIPPKIDSILKIKPGRTPG